MQSLEFVAEMTILTAMKIGNPGKIYFLLGKIGKHTSFAMKIKMIDLWIQIEGTKLIFVISSNLPPEYLKLHRF